MFFLPFENTSLLCKDDCKSRSGIWLSISGAKLYLNGSDSAIWILRLSENCRELGIYGGKGKQAVTVQVQEDALE
jgi:hypothetical protein